MGNWHISIEGHGVHHNRDHPEDANRMAARFANELRVAGHTVTKATITHGGSDELVPDYEERWTKATETT